MKKLLLFLLCLKISIGFGQKIDTYKTDDFKEKPKAIILFVAVADDVDENRRVATNIVKLLPKETTVLKVLNYNKAWTKTPDEMILSEGIKVGAMAVLKVMAVDGEQRQQLTTTNNLFLLQNYQATKYECTLEYVQTQTVLWKAVSKYKPDGCPYVKFIRQAIKEEVL